MSQLFTLEGSTRAHPAVEQWLDARSPELRAIATRWFDEIRASGDDVCELLHDGHPTACVEGVAFAYVNVFRAHVNVGFFRGSTLADPAGLLEGSGRFMRHVKLRPSSAVDAGALRQLIRAAYDDIAQAVRRR